MAASNLRVLVVFAAVLLQGGVTGCGVDTSNAEHGGSETSALCSAVQLGSNAVGPVTGAVTLSASGATCGNGETPEYRFVQRRDGTTALVELQNWSASSSFAWNTTGLASGSYHAFVYARAAGSSKYQSYDTIPLLLGQVCNGITLSSNVSSPQSVGAVVGLTAAATCTGGTAQYQFTAKGRSGSSVTIRDWSSSATANWNTAGLAADVYTITASTRASGNLAFDAQKLLSFRFGETCAVPTLGTTPSSPASVGADVTLNAATNCTGTASPEFRFSYRPSAGGAYVQIQDFSSAASAVWHTTGLPADNYTLSVETRANDYDGPTQARKTSTFVVGASCNAVTLVGTPKSPPPLNAVLSFTANATCSGGSPEYRFSVRAPGSSSYTEFRGWGGSSANFPTSGLSGGAYAFKVETRAVGSVAAYQAQRALAYSLGAVCNGVALATAPPSFADVGSSVQLNASATCVNGGVPEYQFSARAAGAPAWTLLRDWGTASFAWDTTVSPWNTAGDYQVRVSARGQGQLTTSESTRTLNYSLIVRTLAVAAFEPLGFMGTPSASSYTWAKGVNADGSVLVGQNETLPFRWTAATGFQDISPAGSMSGSAYSVSDDGSVVVGYTHTQVNGVWTIQPFRWTSATGAVVLSTPANTGAAFALSGNGLVTGGSTSACSSCGQGLYWVGTGAFQQFNNNTGWVLGASYDGSVLVGESTWGPFRWTSAGGVEYINPSGGTATSTSADGSVVVGYAQGYGFRWTAATGLARLNDDSNGVLVESAYGVSGDGAVVGCNAYYSDGNGGFIHDGAVWTPSAGLVLFADLLTAAHIDYSGWTDFGVSNVSKDGKVIVGLVKDPSGKSEAYRITLQ